MAGIITEFIFQCETVEGFHKQDEQDTETKYKQIRTYKNISE